MKQTHKKRIKKIGVFNRIAATVGNRGCVSMLITCTLVLVPVISFAAGRANDAGPEILLKIDRPGSCSSCLQFQNRGLGNTIEIDSQYADPILGSGGSSYGSELARLDKVLHTMAKIAEKRPNSWLALERVANAHLARARLTGSMNDYISAQSLLKKAFELSKPGSGPVLSRASLNFSLHRLPVIEQDLVAAQSALLVSNSTLAEINGIRADVLLFSGEYSESYRIYKNLDSGRPSVVSAARLAHYFQQTGDYVTAEQWLSQAERRVLKSSFHQRSWLELQLGILDLERGRFNEALGHYQKALVIFSDFWLVEEHIAEIDALQGRHTEAIRKYRDLIARTDSPLFMIALADSLQESKDASVRVEALAWISRAEKRFSQMLNQLPELVSGHALNYFLRTENSSRAMKLAHNNYSLRPNGQSAVLLAQAQGVQGHIEEALQLVENTLATPYRSAELHATAGLLFHVDGQFHRAMEQDALARAINPDAIKNVDWLRSKFASRATAVSAD